MSSFIPASGQNAPLVSKTQIPKALSIKDVIASIDTYKFVAIHQDGIGFEDFYDSLQKSGKYLIEDCTLIRSHEFIFQITDSIGRYHEDIDDIRNIITVVWKQNWELSHKDSQLRGTFIRMCRSMCTEGNYLLFLHQDILDYISGEDSLILQELKKRTKCKLIIFISELEVFEKYKKEISFIKFINMDTPEFPKVYISHHWDSDSDEYVNGLRSALDSERIKYGIDTMDAQYRSKLTDFEEKIGDGFIVVPIINEEYLHSIECMYELSLTSENGHIADRLFPLIIFDIDRSPKGLQQQLDYWKTKYQELIQQSQMLGVGRANISNEDIVRIDKICRQLPTLWEYFKKYLTSTKEELSDNNYELMLKGIKERLALLSSNPQKPNPSPTQPTGKSTSNVTQTGDHAVYIGKIEGDVTINQ